MGNLFSQEEESEIHRIQTSGVASRSNVDQVNSRDDQSGLYSLVKLKGGGMLVEGLRKAQTDGTTDAMDDFRRLLRQKLAPFLRNGREGYEVSIRDLVRKRRVYRESKEKGNKKKQRYVKKNSVFPEVVIETGHVPESQTRRVWWDTDKRGAVGETALHLCLLNNSSLYKDLAREMIAECPGLVNDIYLGDLYYGRYCDM